MATASAEVEVMSDADKAAAYDELLAQQSSASKAPPRYRVVVSNNMAGDRVLFSSVSEKRAKRWVEDHCPRGSHMFLLGPDGSMSSYEAERAGPQGADVEQWSEFDRDAYQAPTLAPISSNDPWADAWEGAQ
jgi:hypothetical protein